MKNFVKCGILVIVMGYISLTLSDNSERVDFFEQLITTAELADKLKSFIEKKQYTEALSILQKIQTALDYAQIAADDLRLKLQTTSNEKKIIKKK